MSSSGSRQTSGPPSPDPGPPASVPDYEERAAALLPRTIFEYYSGGAGDEWTLRENRAAFERWVLRPRVLVDVADRDPATTVLGSPVSFPVLVAPTAFQRMAHPDGELATARAAASAGTVMVLSTIASASMEDVAAEAPEGRRWFQLYIHRDRGLTADLVARAEAAGFGVLVLTVDTPLLGLRDRDTRNRFSLPPGIELANLARSLPEVEGSALFAYMAERHDPSVTWDDLEWVRTLSGLPLVLKGVVRADDAGRAVDAGVDGLVVSNHGGRQLDGTVAAIDALPEVVEAVAGRVEVLLDGGVRRGSDVLRALALGARAVLVGRPVLWGLAVAGEAGVRHVLDLLRAELDVAMAIAGCRAVGEVDGDLVARSPRRGDAQAR
ncbi:MAG: alpha-hydroxy-acid oxidizing protein [Actinobacteria bacterium]|nr:alpha-hydroxy-acid oxidizing protein [Actinomycetota bacterium]